MRDNLCFYSRQTWRLHYLISNLFKRQHQDAALVTAFSPSASSFFFVCLTLIRQWISETENEEKLSSFFKLINCDEGKGQEKALNYITWNLIKSSQLFFFFFIFRLSWRMKNTKRNMLWLPESDVYWKSLNVAF